MSTATSGPQAHGYEYPDGNRERVEKDGRKRRPGEQSLDALNDDRKARGQPQDQQSGAGGAMGESRE